MYGGSGGSVGDCVEGRGGDGSTEGVHMQRHSGLAAARVGDGCVQERWGCEEPPVGAVHLAVHGE
jgi:hypothetical protein